MLKFPPFAVCLFLSVACLSAGAQTNFGSVDIGSSVTQTVTVTVPSATSFTSINVVTFGSTYLDFIGARTGTCAVNVAYAAGQSCTVGVTYRAEYPGLRMGAVVLHSSATNVFATTYIHGTGVGPQLGFNPAQTYAISVQGQTNPRSLFYPAYPAVPLGKPQFPAIDGSGTLYLYDPTITPSAIYKIPQIVQGGPGPSTLIARGPTGDTTGPKIQAIALDGAGNRIIVGTNAAFQMPSGSTVGQEYTDSFAGPATGANFTAAAVDGAGDLFLLDQAYNDVVEFPASNSQATPIHYTLDVDGNPLVNPSGLAVNAAGDLFVSDTGNNRVVEFPAAGGTPTIIAPTVNGKAISGPGCVAIDRIGNLFVCDQNNNRVVEVPTGDSPAMEIAPTVNGVKLGSPKGVAFDSSGYIYIADPDNARVLQVIQTLPPSLSFAETPVGSTSTDSPQIVQAQNIGDATLDFMSLTYPVDFPEGTSSTSPCTASISLGTGEVCNLNINFKPQSAGNFTEGVQISANGPYTTTSDSINVSGSGTNVQLSASSLSYGSVVIGNESASQQITVTNRGTTPLLISGIHVTGANAAAFVFGSTCTSSLAMGASCIVHGHFAPTAAGTVSATLNISYNAADSPQAVTLTGTGLTPPAVTLSSMSLSYGDEAVGTASASQQVTLTNSGGSPLSISGIRVIGANASSFIIGYTCPGSLAAGASCIIHGHFAPTTTGPLTGTISITDHSNNSPQSIALTGTGQ